MKGRAPVVMQDVGMGCARSVVVRVASLAIGLPLGLFAVLGTLWLLFTFDFQPWTLALVAALWVGPFCVGGGLVALVIVRRARKLDGVFVPLGLEGMAYQSFFRQYHGTVSGRQTDVYLWRGPVLSIEIASVLTTRMVVSAAQGDTGFVAELIDRPPLTLADPALAALSVYALDEEWSRSLLADDMAAGALRRLIVPTGSVFTRQQVIVAPGTVKLVLSGNRRLFGLDVTPEQVRLWLDDLDRLVNAAEELPACRVTAEISPAEHLAARMRTRSPYFELWFGLALIAFFVVMAALIFGAVFLFTGLGAT